MTTMAILQEPKKVQILFDTIVTKRGSGPTNEHVTKCQVDPFLGIAYYISGPAMAMFHFKHLITRGRYQSFDDILKDADIFIDTYYKTLDEMMDLEGFEGSYKEYEDFHNERFGSIHEDEPGISLEMCIMGYSEAKKEMISYFCSTYLEFEPIQMPARDFSPFDDKRVVNYRVSGRSPEHCRECVRKSQNHPTGVDDLKKMLGYLFYALLDDGWGEVMCEEGLGGGYALLTTIHADRSIQTRFVGTVDECKALALPMFESKAEFQDRPQANVGRNSPCPCGSGRKHKQCCRGEQ